MVSGIKSLSSTHEQIVIGWTGPVGKTPSTEEGVTEEEETETVVSPAQAEALTSELEAFDERDGQGRVRNVPVWLDKEVAKGHYEGYCKTSTFDELLFAKAPYASSQFVDPLLTWFSQLSGRCSTTFSGRMVRPAPRILLLRTQS